MSTLPGLKPSGIGIVVDKSHATKTVVMNTPPFPSGSRLNEEYDRHWKALEAKGIVDGMTMNISDLRKIEQEIADEQSAKQ